MDEDWEERPNVALVKKLVLQDRSITVKQLLFDTGISEESIELILHGHLNMNKVSAWWVPHFLASEQKLKMVESC